MLPDMVDLIAETVSSGWPLLMVCVTHQGRLEYASLGISFGRGMRGMSSPLSL